ncbi:CatB-related O-acetyltransferase [Halobaculum magnesiiphilum]|uniref:CatB-related O-acetyltransferase n=1 Tax=Halobaculum magnesiiphilum TaxID=1017351 RepID=A0A8T8WEF0_9EURY|nr:CatB-related O-acetyltransferase [Halobaculum magnesiiphilum]QZP38242.1 CatB-related O-acetyltransferase [Halobaculum magnesiiphilum]
MRFYDNFLGQELPHTSKGPIEIGSDVWFGADVTVLSDVQIGPGAVVGAKSVITNDVDPYAVVAGVPAEPKSYRFDEEMREQLLETAWWEWEPERITDNEEFFKTDLRTIDDLKSVIR